MIEKKRGLGRTLEALLAGAQHSKVDDTSKETITAEATAATANVLKELAIDQLQRGQYQPRREMDPETLQELADSIKAQGIIQPIIVRQLGSGRFEIIAGERRFRAAQLAGLTHVPVVIKSLSDEEALAIGLIENIQREDLNPIEEAMALQRLANEFSLTHQDVAAAVGRSRVAVSNLLRLLTLNAEVKTLLERGDLEMGHARALLSLDERQQLYAANHVIQRGLSVRETEQFVRQLLNEATPASANEKILDPDTRHLQQRLSDTLGAKVKIHMQSKGKGKLVISYNSLEELDGILEHIQ